MVIFPFQRRAWVEIDLDAVRHNFFIIKEKCGCSKVCCVVKANAYGHGAIQLSKIYEQIKADFLAVSNIGEALQLRNADISLPILILGYTDPKCASILAQYDISQCVYSKEYADQLAYEADSINVKIKIHLKIDTGMGRLGFKCKNFSTHELEDAVSVCRYSCFVHEGIFTHFSSADKGNQGYRYTKQQFIYFNFAVDYLAKRQIMFSIRHCANSAAILNCPEMNMDMVRAGIVLYGLSPSEIPLCKTELLPVLKLKSIVAHIKMIDKGDAVSYGCTFIADRAMKIATIPIGYADGLLRANRDHLSIEVCGHQAPIVGHICMDQCMVDITDIDDVSLGCTVTIYGTNFDNSIDRIAKANRTINYEILCNIGERVPRVYLQNGTVIEVVDKLITRY